MNCIMGWCSLQEEIAFLVTLLVGYVLGKSLELLIKYEKVRKTEGSGK